MSVTLSPSNSVTNRSQLAGPAEQSGVVGRQQKHFLSLANLCERFHNRSSQVFLSQRSGFTAASIVGGHGEALGKRQC